MKAANKATKILLTLLLINGVLALGACSTVNSQPLRIDAPAPDFKLKDLSGNTVSLSSFKGQSVFLNFWATTCASCVAEMPHFQSLYDDWSSKGVVMLLINMGEDNATVQNFVQSNQYTFQVLLDSQLETAAKYSLQFTPTSFFIDQEGKIKLRIIGAFKDKAAIEKQLAGYIP